MSLEQCKQIFKWTVTWINIDAMFREGTQMNWENQTESQIDVNINQMNNGRITEENAVESEQAWNIRENTKIELNSEQFEIPLKDWKCEYLDKDTHRPPEKFMITILK